MTWAYYTGGQIDLGGRGKDYTEGQTDLGELYWGQTDLEGGMDYTGG